MRIPVPVRVALALGLGALTLAPACSRPDVRPQPYAPAAGLSPDRTAPARPCLRAVPVAVRADQEVGAAVAAGAAPAREAPAAASQVTTERVQGWARRFGGAEGDEAAAVAITPAGDIYVVGQLGGAVTLGDEQLDSAGHSDMLTARLSAGGEIVWARALGGPAHDLGTGVAAGPDGAVALGAFAGWMRAGAATLRAGGPTDLVLAAYDAGGDLRWIRQLGGPDWEIGNAVAMDQSGDILVAGAFSERMRLGDQVLESAGEADAFVARLDPEGVPRWARRMGGPGWDEAAAVAVAPDGGVIAAGIRGEGAFVRKYHADGTVAWTRELGERGTAALAVTVEPGGEILVAGGFHGELRLGDRTLTSTGAQDFFVARLDGRGAPLWAAGFGGPGRDCARAVVLAPGSGAAAGFAVAGTFSGDIELGGVRLQGAPGDAFLARYDARGEPQWAVAMSAPVAGTRSIAVDPLGRLVAAGSFLDSMTVGAHVLESAGGFDAFVITLAQPAQ